MKALSAGEVNAGGGMVVLMLCCSYKLVVVSRKSVGLS